MSMPWEQSRIAIGSIRPNVSSAGDSLLQVMANNTKPLDVYLERTKLEAQTEKDRQDRLAQQDIANKRADAGLLMQQEEAQQKKDAILQSKGTDRALKEYSMGMNDATSDFGASIGDVYNANVAKMGSEAAAKQAEQDIKNAEIAFVKSPELQQAQLLRTQMPTGYEYNSAPLLATRQQRSTDIENMRETLAQEQYRKDTLTESKRAREVAQANADRAYNYTVNKDITNTKLFKDMAGVTKTKTAGEINGNKAVETFFRNIESKTPKDQAAMDPKLVVRGYENALSKDREVVANPRYEEEIQQILANSGADIPTRSILSQMIYKSKGKKEDTPESIEAAAYAKTLGVEKAKKEVGYGKEDGKLLTSMLASEIKPILASDDNVEDSLRKVISAKPEIETYAKTHGMSNREVVDLLKVKIAGARSALPSIYDTDAEDALDELLGTNH
jgi:hypothetical protein